MQGAHFRCEQGPTTPTWERRPVGHEGQLVGDGFGPGVVVHVLTGRRASGEGQRHRRPGLPARPRGRGLAPDHPGAGFRALPLSPALRLVQRDWGAPPLGGSCRSQAPAAGRAGRRFTCGPFGVHGAFSHTPPRFLISTTLQGRVVRPGRRGRLGVQCLAQGHTGRAARLAGGQVCLMSQSLLA